MDGPGSRSLPGRSVVGRPAATAPAPPSVSWVDPADAACWLDARDRITAATDAAGRLFRRDPAELVGLDLGAELGETAGAAVRRAQEDSRTSARPADVDVLVESTGRWVQCLVVPARGPGELVVFLRDVHDRRAREERRSQLTSAVLDALPAQVALLDADGRVLLTNAAWNAAAGDPAGPFRCPPGADYLAVTAAGDASAFAVSSGVRAVLAGRAAEFRHDHAHLPATGSPSERAAADPAGVVPGAPTGTRWFAVHVVPAGSTGQVVVTHTDVTDRVQAERRSAHQARHDHLTELLNRAALLEVIRSALADADTSEVTLLYMDVDGFKGINDLRGHEAGDELLRELAGRLAHRTRPTDSVGRLGGDEFVVVARDCGAAGGDALVARFRRAFDEPFRVGGVLVPLTASMGVATSAPGHETPEDLLRDADLAMYAAKAGGRNRHVTFTPSMRGWLENRWRLTPHS